MPSPFVWFDNMTAQQVNTTQFLQDMFGWKAKDGGSMTFLMVDGADMPFAATCEEFEGITGWVPYIEVDDLSAAVARARQKGALVVAEDVKGPAGDTSFVRDPGGSVLALWKRAEGM